MCKAVFTDVELLQSAGFTLLGRITETTLSLCIVKGKKLLISLCLFIKKKKNYERTTVSRRVIGVSFGSAILSSNIFVSFSGLVSFVLGAVVELARFLEFFLSSLRSITDTLFLPLVFASLVIVGIAVIVNGDAVATNVVSPARDTKQRQMKINSTVNYVHTEQC